MTPLQEAMAAVRTNPKSSEAWSRLGEVLAAEGQAEKSRESYQRALQLDPANSAARMGLLSVLTSEEGGAAESPAPRPAAAAPPPAATPPAAVSAPRPDATERVPAVRAAPRQSSSTAAPPPRQTARTLTVPTGGAFRQPQPRPVKPTPARMWAGLGGMLALFLVCFCILVLAVAQLLPG